MNEWVLQKRLTERWLTRGLTLDGEALFLAAWEVMTDWRINDAHRHWTHPSIDFLFLDQAGQLVAIELKIEISSPADAWRALCQVTHRAEYLGRSYTPGLLASAYQACRSGEHGRVPPGSVDLELPDAHARFFGLGAASLLPGRPVRRVVAARDFARVWYAVLDQFNTSTPEAIAAQLRKRYHVDGRSNRELARYLALDGRTWVCAPGVQHLEVWASPEIVEGF